jgi:multicomponent Na+:H+ antiporter subunit B
MAWTIEPFLFLMVLVVAIAVARVKDLFAAAMLTGMFTLLCAGIYLMMDAVDVAFTEAAVGAGISTVLVLGTLSLTANKERQQSFRPGPLVVVVLTGGALLYGMLDMAAYGDPASPIHAYDAVSPAYIRGTMENFHIPNIVTAVLGSYRGYDTFGETTVVFTAAVGVMLLLGSRKVKPDTIRPVITPSPVVEAAAPVVEAAAPVVEAAAPVVEAAAPVVEAVAPVVEAAAPVAEAPPALAVEAPTRPNVLSSDPTDLPEPLSFTETETVEMRLEDIQKALAPAAAVASAEAPALAPAPAPAPAPALDPQPDAAPADVPPHRPMGMRDMVVLRVVTKAFIPLIMLFALYVQFHGDFGPGGGFQAGVIFAAGLILYGLIYGLDTVQRVAPPKIMEKLIAVGVLLYGGVGIVSLLMGGSFLDYGALNHHSPSHGQHLGLLLIEGGVGLAVAATMTIIYYYVAGRGLVLGERS